MPWPPSTAKAKCASPRLPRAKQSGGQSNLEAGIWNHEGTKGTKKKFGGKAGMRSKRFLISSPSQVSSCPSCLRGSLTVSSSRGCAPFDQARDDAHRDLLRRNCADFDTDRALNCRHPFLGRHTFVYEILADHSRFATAADHAEPGERLGKPGPKHLSIMLMAPGHN